LNLISQGGVYVMELDYLGSVEAWEPDPGVYVVTARGPIDERMTGDFESVLVPLAAADGTELVVDLDDAHGIDAAALDVLGRAAHLAACRGARIQIVTQRASTLDLIQDCGLGELVDCVPTLQLPA
jgi:anti-anti-sigma factor